MTSGQASGGDTLTRLQICCGPMTQNSPSLHHERLHLSLHASAVPERFRQLYCKLIRIKG